MRLPIPIPEDFQGAIYCSDEKTARKVLVLIVLAKPLVRWASGCFPNEWCPSVGCFPLTINVQGNTGRLWFMPLSRAPIDSYILEEEEYAEI